MGRTDVVGVGGGDGGGRMTSGGPPGASIAIDPVCGMAVERRRSFTLKRDGRLVSFCSRGCRDEFLGAAPGPDEARAFELVRRVLDSPELLGVAFQPIVSLRTAQVVGYEALARFAPVPLQLPEAWFELGARAGLTVELEALALRRALECTRGLDPPGEAFLALNVSPLGLNDPRIQAVLLGPAVPPRLRIVLELTERDAVADYESLRGAIEPYRARGMRISVDDTGAGYASLRHVTELRPDFIKLDARLIRGLTGDEARQALVAAMATFAAAIGSNLIAEGVEALEDLAALVRVGRPILVQGFAIGRPGDPWPRPNQACLDRLQPEAISDSGVVELPG